jgi:xylan 1,4-beta-xylosidase
LVSRTRFRAGPSPTFSRSREQAIRIFHGGFGIINYQGIPKPVFHGYRFMKALGDELLTSTPGAVATRDAKSGKLVALAYNYPAEMTSALPGTWSMAEADKIADTGSSRRLDVLLSGTSPNAPLMIETLDKSHGNATALWEDMGSPEPPTREQAEALKAGAFATKRELVHADASGRFELQRSINPWSLVLIKQL